MKTICLMVVVLFQITMAAASSPPYDGQPSYVGMTDPSLTTGGYYRWATLFKGGGGRFYFSCRHWHPEPGQMVTFGDGQSSVVKKVFMFGPPEEDVQWDFSIGELETPVTSDPIDVWWAMPNDLVQWQIRIKGWGKDRSNPGDWFLGEKGVVMTDTHLLNYQNPDYAIQTGYSGTHNAYKDKVIGVTIASSPGRATACLVCWVYGNWWPQFPPELQPKMTISPRIGQEVRVTLKAPPGVFKVHCSPNLQEGAQWLPVEECPGYLGRVETTDDWETVIRWDTTVDSRMFFRAQIP